MATPSETITYLLSATDTSTGCIDTAYFTIIVKDEKNVFIPNVITPNGDGVNDVWNISDLNEIFQNHELTVINRWGDEVYRARPYNNDWGGTYNGQLLPDGTYYYIIKLNDINKVISGPLTIIKQ